MRRGLFLRPTAEAELRLIQALPYRLASATASESGLTPSDLPELRLGDPDSEAPWVVLRTTLWITDTLPKEEQQVPFKRDLTPPDVPEPPLDDRDFEAIRVVFPPTISP